MTAAAKPEVEQSEKGDTQTVERGTQHPVDNLESAIANLEKVKDAIGFSAASRDTIIGAWGHASMSGHASRKLGVQTHFGLLEKTGKGSLKISDLGKKILVPTDAAERRAAIVEAAGRPVLYAKLIDKYKENALPTMLPNLLIREHGVFPGSAPNAARAFRETVEYAGLLRNGVLHTTGATDTSQDQSAIGQPAGAEPNSSTDSASKDQANLGRTVPHFQSLTQGYTIPLDQTGRVASITIPVPVTRRDLRKIGAWVTYASDNFFDEDSEQSETPNVSTL